MYKVHLFWEGHTNYLSYVLTVSQIIGGDFANVVAFSEYMNFKLDAQGGFL